MSPSPEQMLQRAVQMHQSADFKECMKAAEKARKDFQKQGRRDRAMEALRVMGDCAVNAHELKKAERFYEDLIVEGQSLSSQWHLSAAHWGLGQVALRSFDYVTAAKHFDTGLYMARQIADNWYLAWNAFGLANAQRGMGNIGATRALLQESLDAFRAGNQTGYMSWVTKALSEIGVEASTQSTEIKVWLCPLCGSKFNASQVESLKVGRNATCEYCGATAG